MNRLSDNYAENVKLFDTKFNVDENFDIIKKSLSVGSDELTFYYVDGFIKDAVMSKLMLSFAALKGLDGMGADEFSRRCAAYVETDVSRSLEFMVQMVMSGAALMLGNSFGANAIVIDARSYPSRSIGEPQNDRVMLGSRDGFVEGLIFNTSLIRRRIRDTARTMKHFTVGEKTKTDVVMCYMSDRADAEYVDTISKKLSSVQTESILCTMNDSHK